MKKTFITLAITLLASFASAQTMLDIATIEDIAKNEKEYYNDIVELYSQDDPYLDVNDIAIIYYGQAFQPGFNPNSDDEKALKKFAAEMNYTEVYNTAKRITESNPVSLNALFNLLVSSKELGKEENECKSYALKYMQILNMITEYGDGKSSKTAFKVISPDDQDYILYGMLNVNKVISHELDKETLCNIFIIEPTDEFQQRRVYFDLTLYLTSASN